MIYYGIVITTDYFSEPRTNVLKNCIIFLVAMVFTSPSWGICPRSSFPHSSEVKSGKGDVFYITLDKYGKRTLMRQGRGILHGLAARGLFPAPFSSKNQGCREVLRHARPPDGSWRPKDYPSMCLLLAVEDLSYLSV